MNCSNDVCVDTLADILISELDSRVTGADVENVCRRAVVSCIRGRISSGNIPKGDTPESEELKIVNKNFLEALVECFPSLSAESDVENEKQKEGEGDKQEEASVAAPFEWTGTFSGGAALDEG